MMLSSVNFIQNMVDLPILHSRNKVAPFPPVFLCLRILHFSSRLNAVPFFFKDLSLRYEHTEFYSKTGVWGVIVISRCLVDCCITRIIKLTLLLVIIEHIFGNVISILKQGVHFLWYFITTVYFYCIF